MYENKRAIVNHTLANRGEYAHQSREPMRLARMTCYLLILIGGVTVFMATQNKTNSVGALHMLLITLSVVIIGCVVVIIRSMGEYVDNVAHERMEEMQSCRNRIDSWISGLRDTQSKDIGQIAAGLGGLAKTVASSE